MKFERGGLVLGLIVGLLIGLALALGVALYVTKAPVPFVNKVPPRTAEHDAAEAERNKTWNPNAPLGGKPVQPQSSLPPLASSPPFPPPASGAGAAMPPPIATRPPAKDAARDPASILADVKPATPPVVSAAPATGPKSSKTAAEPFIFFVQAGAFQSSVDAEQQRAKLAMLGVESRVVEREQSGRTVFRVRIGPFERQVEADTMKGKLESSGVEALLVRLDRRPQ
jgi:cell division protein FtsN